jgi:hypothetical protein
MHDELYDGRQAEARIDQLEKRRELRQRGSLDAIQGMLESDGWLIVEEHIKDLLKAEYSGFMHLKSVFPWVVRRKQRKVTAYLDVIRSIYRLAKRQWCWDGYESIEEAMDAGIPKERRLFFEAMRELQG